MNIIIADDSLLSRSYLKKIITVSGYAQANIFEVGNGAEALEILESKEVKCLFLDINMPIMTGIELVEQLSLKGLIGKTEIVITSSLADEKCIEMLKGKGVKYFLRKPFTPESMAKILNIFQGKAA
jgi:CheY-like chemotaxis protein